MNKINVLSLSYLAGVVGNATVLYNAKPIPSPLKAMTCLKQRCNYYLAVYVRDTALQVAPNASRALLNSSTAVFTSLKASADTAYLEWVSAWLIESSSCL